MSTHAAKVATQSQTGQHTRVHTWLHMQGCTHTEPISSLHPLHTQSYFKPTSFSFKVVPPAKDRAGKPPLTFFPLDSHPLSFQQLLLWTRLG